jgi:hypothetical protein
LHFSIYHVPTSSTLILSSLLAFATSANTF